MLCYEPFVIGLKMELLRDTSSTNQKQEQTNHDMTVLGFPRNYMIKMMLQHRGYDSNNASFLAIN